MSTATAGAAPGFVKRPEHVITIAPHTVRVRAVVDDTVIAESDRALLVEETGHDPVLYLPLDDVAGELLARTEHSTYCPFKGDATYWSVRFGDETLDNVVWGYELPFDEMTALKDHVAFYTTGVAREGVGGDAVDVLAVGRA